MYVSNRIRVGCYESQQKADQLVVVLHDPCSLPQLVEEHRMGEGSRRSSPPLIDDLYDLVVVSLLKGSCEHRFQPTTSHTGGVTDAALLRAPGAC